MFYTPKVATTKIITWSKTGENSGKDVYIPLNTLSLFNCTITVLITPGTGTFAYTYDVLGTCDLSISSGSNWLKMVRVLDGSAASKNYLDPFTGMTGNCCGVLKSPATYLKFSVNPVSGTIPDNFKATLTLYQPDLRII